MGLFGGFKAKLFNRNKNKPSEVICLSYHINSEVYGTPRKSDKTQIYFDNMTNLQPLPQRFMNKILENMK